MKDNNALWPIAVLLFIFAGVMPQAGRPGVAAPEQATSSTDKSAESKPVCRYDVEFPELIEEWRDSENKAALIATIPDPIDSHVGWLFEGQLEAIVNAIEQGNYARVAYALPWECAQNAREIDKNAGLRLKLELLHHNEPGIVLFRNDSENKRLALFLVSETPTAGVYPKALRRALDFAFESRDAIADSEHYLREQGCTRVVRLMAPTFSGSADPLREALTGWWNAHDPQLCFRVISGSASAIKVKSRITGRPSAHAEQTPVIDFHATVVPFEAILNNLFDHLEGLGADIDKDVALLAESGTLFGRAALGRSTLSKIRSRLRDKSTNEAKDADRTEGLDRNFTVLRFPMHIGRLRSTAKKNRTNRPQDADLPRTMLELSLDETGTPRDLLPSFFPKSQTVSDELVLRELLSTISRERYRYVGLLATDPQDKLFLAQKIREFCPDVGLFTVENDLFFTHPDFNPILKGMIVGSTYPLFNINQRWNPTFTELHQRLQFPRSAAQGAYNATLALLGRSMLRDYRAPFEQERPEGGFRPPIWLSAVGQGALWPLKTTSDYQDFEDAEGSESVTTQQDGYVFRNPVVKPVVSEPVIPTPGSIHLVLVPVSALLVAYLAALTGPLRQRWSPKLFDVIAPRSEHYRDGFGRRLYLGVCLCALILAFGILALGPLLGTALSDPDHGLWASATRYGWAVFFHQRSVNLGSGVSPFVPVLFLCLGSYVLGICHLRRLRLLGGRPQLACYGGLDYQFKTAEKRRSVKSLAQDIDEVIRQPPWRCGWPVIVLAIAITLACIYIFYRIVPTLDARGFYHGFLVALFLLFFGVVTCFLRFAILWQRLTSLLAHFTLHPMISAFDRLPRRLAGIARWRLYARPQSIEPIAIQGLLLLANQPAEVHPELQEWLSACGLPKDAVTQGVLPAIRSGQYSQALNRLAAVLARYWWPQPWDGPSKPSLPEQLRLWVRSAEDAIAIDLVGYINYIFVHLWNLLTAGTVALFAMVFAVGSYPFQPQRLLSIFFFMVVVLLVSFTAVILIRMNRNDLLSRIAKTEPGKLSFGWGLVPRLVIVAIPLLGLATALFPQMDWLLSWIDWLLRMLK